MALNLSELSHCVRKKVGCVFVKNGRIVSSGVNGEPPGYPNCDEVNVTEEQIKNHHVWSDIHTLHAEINATVHAAKEGISLKDSVVYCTLRPCIHCAKALIGIGIKEIYYIEDYDNIDPEIDKEARQFLKDCGVRLIKYGI